jgi:dihydropteroate synthase-like protein
MMEPTMSDRLNCDTQRHYHFVTGKLAEAMVREVVESLAQRYFFQYSIEVLPITVAALMNAKWLLRKWNIPKAATHVIVPGYLESGIPELQENVAIPVILGPKDCRLMGEIFGATAEPPTLDDYSIEIIAEINHVPRMAVENVVQIADRLIASGANLIDLGCDPGNRCATIGEYVIALVDRGYRVSIDSFDTWEVQHAIDAGASLVLSVDSTNRQSAVDWGVEVVVIPDSPTDTTSLDETIEFLRQRDVPFRLDPILEPIGHGFARSVGRYIETRRRYPDAPMLMGIGNLTELTDVDSAGVNMVLIALCQELGIQSVLTTEVINWARSSVRECDIARRICRYAVGHGLPPKRVSDDLVMLRDPKVLPDSVEMLRQLAGVITDRNYRLFVAEASLHIVSSGLHLSDSDPFALFDRLLAYPIAENVDASHAFYLGFELAKASIALTLSKQYTQDEPLRWGMHTDHRRHHRIARKRRTRGEEHPEDHEP